MADDIVDLLSDLAARRPPNPGQGDRVVAGLAGRGIQESRTPAMHEREAARHGLQCTYLLIDFDRLGLVDEQIGAVIAAARHCGFHGLNVTHPFKQVVSGHLDALAPEAEAIGAVNTVIFQRDRTVGHNTDNWGFAESFRAGMQGAALGRVFQLGAGGAGAAVAHALLDLGAGELVIVDVDPEKAEALARRMSRRFDATVSAVRSAESALADVNGIVNTTPIGMAKYPGVPFNVDRLDPLQWVAEIIYFPPETELLRQARARGCRTLAGTGMAIYQAVRAFELFTGRVADPKAMASHFESAA
ncbi:shikimate dehydrogenase [Mesorhizobium sp. CN2-181]|uniref:shikimate dehydrogenase n=1 Tax=Mesorhizobium yinganensis TaxID=3157707 RepID=UPI0032B813C8